MAAKQVVAYTADSGKKYKCRLSAATVTAQPTAPGGGPYDVPLFATVGESRKKYGVHTRYANLNRNIGTAGAPNIVHAKLPIMKAADAATIAAAGTVDYAGQTWTVSSITGESSR